MSLGDEELRASTILAERKLEDGSWLFLTRRWRVRGELAEPVFWVERFDAAKETHLFRGSTPLLRDAAAFYKEYEHAMSSSQN